MKMTRTVFIITIIILLNAIGIVRMSREINNLLVNDLNIIATKLDDIPFTNLNVQLVLLAYNCRDLLITWNVASQESTSTDLTSTLATTNNGHYQTIGTSTASTYDPATKTSKAMGFQIVVREYLSLQDENNNHNANGKPPLNKTMRLYTSKYIDVNAKQNKFKLRNLLFNNLATYDICLVIYFDVVETVGFEKQCVQFNLPYSLYKNNKLCKNNSSSDGDGLAVSTATKSVLQNQKFNSKVQTLEDDPDLITNKPFIGTTTTSVKPPTDHPFDTTESVPYSTEYTNLSDLCVHFAASKSAQDCAQYSNLIIAFVICIIFLATNIFMFSIIILQFILKRLMVRKRKKQLESATHETIVDRSKTPGSLHSTSKSQLNGHTHKRISTATPYHQTHNVCMYDKCYKNNYKGFKNHSLHSGSKVLDKPRRSKSLGHKLIECLCCIKWPEIDEHHKTSKCHHAQYADMNESPRKNKIQGNPNEIARAGYILQMPNAGLQQVPDMSPPATPSSITTGSTMSSFDRIRKIRKLNNWFSLKRKEQQLQQQLNFNPQQFTVQQLAAQQIAAAQQMAAQQQQHLTQQQLNQLIQQNQMNKFNQLNYLNPQFRRSMLNSTCTTEQDGSSVFDDDDESSFDSEIFYHYPNKHTGPQMSSAF